MDLTTILITIISGSLSAAIFTVIFQNKRYKGTLVEKWMCEFRDEVSELIGKAEELRQHRHQGGQSQTLTHQLIRNKQKIHMLLNFKPDQEGIYDCANELIDMADKNVSPKLYESKEEELVKKSRTLLNTEWKKVSRFWSKQSVLHILTILNVIGWTSFVLIDNSLAKIIAEAVSDGSKTYGELYGPMAFLKTVALIFSGTMTAIVSVFNLLKLD